MVRDSTRATASRIDQFPFDGLSRVVVVEQSVDSGQVESPHGSDGALLKVTSAVHVKTKNKVRIRLNILTLPLNQTRKSQETS